MGMNRDAMARLQQMQAQLMKSQADLAEHRVSATSGGGAVAVTVTGGLKVEALTIQPDMIAALNNFGAVCTDMGLTGEALECIELLIKRQPDQLCSFFVTVGCVRIACGPALADGVAALRLGCSQRACRLGQQVGHILPPDQAGNPDVDDRCVRADQR